MNWLGAASKEGWDIEKGESRCSLQRSRSCAASPALFTGAVEVRVGATTADVLYVDDTPPIFPRKIAIEAKDWKAPLTSKDIAEIYGLYQPALSARTIDHLWIIGNHPLSGSPRSTVDTMAHVVYTTFDEFKSSLINFQPVLAQNISAFEQDASFDSFIETRVRNLYGT